MDNYFRNLWAADVLSQAWSMQNRYIDDNINRFCYLRFDIHKKPAEVPVSLVNEVIKLWSPECPISAIDSTTLVVNIEGHMESSRYYCRPTSSILRKLSDHSSYSRLFTEVTNQNKYGYIGDKGILMDADRNLLLLATVTVSPTKTNEIGYQISKPKLYISPKVFVNKNNLLEKAIIQDVIPYYSYNDCELMPIPETRASRTEIINEPVEIIIKDLDEFVVKPKTPDIKTISDIETRREIIQEYCEHL